MITEGKEMKKTVESRFSHHLPHTFFTSKKKPWSDFSPMKRRGKTPDGKEPEEAAKERIWHF